MPPCAPAAPAPTRHSGSARCSRSDTARRYGQAGIGRAAPKSRKSSRGSKPVNGFGLPPGAAARAQIAAHEPVLVEVVQRELVDVDAQRRDPPPRRRNRPETRAARAAGPYRSVPASASSQPQHVVVARPRTRVHGRERGSSHPLAADRGRRLRSPGDVSGTRTSTVSRLARRLAARCPPAPAEG